ncbi:putative transposase [Bordetella holmesii 1058]|uniref:Transposase n=1 Tax=Bordetella holmesii 1058 TaxID=1247648 RepID=A0ABP3BMH5_9BORD|nr:putative transposase [Bordetella holmesii 1058]
MVLPTPPATPARHGITGCTGSGQRHRRLGSLRAQAKRPICTGFCLAVATGSTPASSRASTTPSKSIKRRAYGYRDQEYFFLKIRSAFPVIPR